MEKDSHEHFMASCEIRERLVGHFIQSISLRRVIQQVLLQHCRKRGGIEGGWVVGICQQLVQTPVKTVIVERLLCIDRRLPANGANIGQVWLRAGLEAPVFLKSWDKRQETLEVSDPETDLVDKEEL